MTNEEKDLLNSFELNYCAARETDWRKKESLHLEAQRLYYNREIERNFPNEEFVDVNGRHVLKKNYDSDEEYRSRCEELKLDVK